MSDAFTPEQIAQLQGIIAGMLPSTPSIATPATVPFQHSDIGPEIGLNFAAGTGETKSKAATAEQLAADAVDPERNVYTPLARKYDFALYEPIWRKERERLLAAGVPKSAAGKQAQANYTARLKIEKARLAARDGITRRAPVVDPEKIRSIGTHSDPTANQAIGKVDRIAELRAELASLESEHVELSIPTKERKAASARSVAQRAVKANPFQRSVDKLVREASASEMPRAFLNEWFNTNKQASPSRAAIVAKTATEAAKALGIPVKG